ncbi:glycoprotein [Sena Madureira virus]|uniref:Glycoprotein n=1 Tax=Sena Madureira virus TaxID=1272957 RepID=A0A0D3R151_9RHAB|nr:glycoprotein [Sena Madureira virus]AJR28439.1 glycoprotein [Sena Madureira virus]
MKEYGLILLAIGAIQIANGSLFYFPSEKDLHWHPINHTSIRCPIRSGDKYPGDSANVQFSVPYRDPKHLLNGYSCHKTKWVSECTESWYWTTDIKQYIRVLPVSKEECVNELRNREEGQSLSPFFEAPVCQWANTVRKEKDFVILNKKRMQLDPYSLEVVDPLLLTGRCKTSLDGCKTIQDGVLWFSEENPKKAMEMRVLGLKYSPKGGDMKDLVIWGEGIPLTKMSKACKMQYANTEGVRFESGFWGVPLAGTDQKFTNWKENLQDCPEGSIVKLPSAHEEIAEHQIEIDDLVLSLQCIDVINNFKNTNQISFTDLALLTPDHAGLANAYRINRGILEATTAYYYQCKLKSNVDNVICYGGQDFNIPVKWNGWVDSGTPGTASAFNGVYRKEGKIINANENLMMNRIMDEDIMMRDIQPVRHPIEIVANKNQSLPQYFFDWTGERGNPVEDVFEGVSKFWRKVIEWIAIGFFSIIGVLFFTIFVKIIWSFKRGNRKSKNSDQELNLFR